MFSTLNAFLDRLFQRLFAERPASFDPWFFDYFKELEEPAGRKRYARALAADLDLARFRPEGKVVVDAGSGFGVTLLSLAALGTRAALGIEAFRPMAETSRRLAAEGAPGLPALVVRGSVHDIPLRDGAVDFIYCNEAISHFRQPDIFLREAGRVLGRGGKLMICDGNNAANPRTVSRVREIWKRFEEGPPAEDFHGHRVAVPYRERRRILIAGAFAGLPEDRLERLAWGTFGLHGEAIRTRARELLEGGTLPAGPPVVDRSPVDPEKGDYIENLVDPDHVSSVLRPLGFSVRVFAHFGGARGPLVAGVNRILRSLSPLTLSSARSVKIVATKL